jgi:hypothetical protein
LARCLSSLWRSTDPLSSVCEVLPLDVSLTLDSTSVQRAVHFRSITQGHLC